MLSDASAAQTAVCSIARICEGRITMEEDLKDIHWQYLDLMIDPISANLLSSKLQSQQGAGSAKRLFQSTRRDCNSLVVRDW